MLDELGDMLKLLIGITIGFIIVAFPFWLGWMEHITNQTELKALKVEDFDPERSGQTVQKIRILGTDQSINVMNIYTKSAEAGIDPVSALNIAICESRLDDKALSKTSSAAGLFQFTKKTWETYCKGDVLNADDNINCFIKLYPKYPNWWECKA